MPSEALTSEPNNSRYDSLRAIYVICIVGFEQFLDTKPLHSFCLRDDENDINYGQVEAGSELGSLLNVTFLELSKAGGVVEKRIADLLDFFLGNDVSTDAKAYLKEAQMMTDEQKLSSEERWMLLRKDMARVDRLAQMEYAVNEGRETIARAALLKGLAPDFVAEITGLELAIVKRIQAELN